MDLNVGQHKSLKHYEIVISSVIITVTIFYVWLKAILFSIWAREVKRLDTAALGLCEGCVGKYCSKER